MKVAFYFTSGRGEIVNMDEETYVIIKKQLKDKGWTGNLNLDEGSINLEHVTNIKIIKENNETRTN